MNSELTLAHCPKYPGQGKVRSQMTQPESLDCGQGTRNVDPYLLDQVELGLQAQIGYVSIQSILAS